MLQQSTRLSQFAQFLPSSWNLMKKTIEVESRPCWSTSDTMTKLITSTHDKLRNSAVHFIMGKAFLEKDFTQSNSKKVDRATVMVEVTSGSLISAFLGWHHKKLTVEQPWLSEARIWPPVPYFARHLWLMASDNIWSQGLVSEMCSGTWHCNHHCQNNIHELEV